VLLFRAPLLLTTQQLDPADRRFSNSGRQINHHLFQCARFAGSALIGLYPARTIATQTPAGCRKTKATAVVLAPNGDQVPPLRPQACHPRLLLPHASANGKTSHNYVEVNAIANASLMCASDQRTPIDLLFPHVLLQHRRANSLTRDPIKSRSVRRLY